MVFAAVPIAIVSFIVEPTDAIAEADLLNISPRSAEDTASVFPTALKASTAFVAVSTSFVYSLNAFMVETIELVAVSIESNSPTFL